MINKICINCGAPAEHMHHVVPKVLGGNNTTNLVPLCSKCHGLVHNKTMVSKELQRIGIEKAKLKGKYKGKPKILIDKDKFIIEFQKAQNHQQTHKQAMENLHLKPNTYYRRIKEWTLS